MKTQRYLKEYGIDRPPLKKVLRWKAQTLLSKKRPKVPDDDFRLKVHFLHKEDIDTEEDFILWLGHASFYIQLQGIKILTDPVFGDITMFKRQSPTPIETELLNPDIILISHGHFDHLDLPTLQLLDVYKRQTKIILPSNLSSYLKKEANVDELGWYESVERLGIKITALPASHWHRRGIFDFNRALWCSFLIEVDDTSIFFAGDTAFDKHFFEIKKRYPAIDTALMPIGAYLPREIMQDNHMNPQEALQATEILGATRMIPYHYATFILSQEPIGEPHSWISRLSKESTTEINILDVGEIFSVK